MSSLETSSNYVGLNIINEVTARSCVSCDATVRILFNTYRHFGAIWRLNVRDRKIRCSKTQAQQHLRKHQCLSTAIHDAMYRKTVTPVHITLGLVSSLWKLILSLSKVHKRTRLKILDNSVRAKIHTFVSDKKSSIKQWKQEMSTF